jgi:GH24 family phage-related lysozyme (muramidase)
MLYGMKDKDLEKLMDDPEKAKALQNAIFFGGAAEVRDTAREVFGKNQKRLDDFMENHFPDFEDMEEPSDIVDLVKQEEALRLKPYKDQAGHWTVGFGHKLEGDELKHFQQGITKDQANYLFEQDWNEARAQAEDTFRRAGHDWDSLDRNRRDMLTEMAFNVGPGGLGRYKTLMRAINDEDYKEMGKHYRRFAKDAQTGKWSDLHRNKQMFDMFIKPNVDEADLAEIESHWQKKNRQLGIAGSRPITRIRDGNKTHTLGRNQTLSDVGRQYEMPVRRIMQANPDIKKHQIKAGTTLIIPPKEK